MIPIRDLHTQQRGRTPFITLLLIAANALLFFFELSLGQQLNAFIMSAAFVPARLAEGGLTAGDIGPGLQSGLLSMFLHGGWGHFLGNMLFLWIFGDNVEDRLGHFRFLVFYLAAGYAATLAHYWANPGSAIPAVGASGAISGVLGAYLFLHPMARIRTLVFFGFFLQMVDIPALIYLPVWFLIQFFSGVVSFGSRTAQEAGGVAWFAHIGGFVAGPLLLLLLGGGRRPPARQARERSW
jgi:membrane associated rhomboid family serine protease